MVWSKLTWYANKFTFFEALKILNTTNIDGRLIKLRNPSFGVIFFNDILAYTKCQHVDTNLSFICPPNDKMFLVKKKRINECITQPNLHVQTEDRQKFLCKQRIISDGNTCVTNVHRNCLKCQMACFRLWRFHCLRNQNSVLAHTQKCSTNPTPGRRMNISLCRVSHVGRDAALVHVTS